MDAAHFKSPGTGCLTSRVTLTGNRELVPLGTSHFLLGECNWTAQAFLKAEQVTTIDGGVALNNNLSSFYPQRHLTQDLKKKGKIDEEACAFLAKHEGTPRARLKTVEDAVESMKAQKPRAWALLAGLWKTPEKVCLAYLPLGAHHHGNVISNNVESFNYMAMPLRKQPELLASLLHMLHLLSRRHAAAYRSLPEVASSNAERDLAMTNATRDAVR
eukprot:1653137-Pleurochrysis_carterae.AAC.4